MAMRMKVSSGSARMAARRSSVVVRAQKESSMVEKVQIAAASFVAAALLASPANAGVVLEQPQLKKVFVDTTPAAAPAPKSKEIPNLKTKASAPAVAAKAAEAPKPKVESSGEGGPDLDVRAVALPGALGAVVAGYFALSKLDSGFAEFAYNTAVRDSNEYAGFEPAIKNGTPGAGKKAGTTKVKAAKKK